MHLIWPFRGQIVQKLYGNRWVRFSPIKSQFCVFTLNTFFYTCILGKMSKNYADILKLFKFSLKVRLIFILKIKIVKVQTHVVGLFIFTDDISYKSVNCFKLEILKFFKVFLLFLTIHNFKKLIAFLFHIFRTVQQI